MPYVKLYQLDDFGGQANTFTGDTDDLTAWYMGDTSKDWNDRTSSVRLSEYTIFYEDINYGGAAWGLPAGSWTTSDLEANGIPNNTVSSFKIIGGYY
jgi:Beta/Gamma crystallin